MLEPIRFPLFKLNKSVLRVGFDGNVGGLACTDVSDIIACHRARLCLIGPKLRLHVVFLFAEHMHLGKVVID
jgi:hypothetical protein